MPAISVIVPVYKVEKYIHRCVDSILGQTFTDFELILVDDGSPDSCGAICDEYAVKDDRVIVIHQKNGGLSAARNAGIDWIFANSDSDWMAFVDSDDWVHPQYLELLHRACLENGTALAVCQHATTKECSVEYSHYPDYPAERMHIHDFFIIDGKSVSWVNAWGKLYSKQTFSHLRYPVGLLFEDLHALPSILRTNSMGTTIYAPLYYYYLSPGSIMRSAWYPQKWDEIAGYEKLLRYLNGIKQEEMYQNTVLRFLHALVSQIHALTETRNRAYNGYLRKMRRKMRWILLRDGRKLPGSWKEKRWVYDNAYVKIAYVYWTMVGIVNKLKKSLRICRK